MKKTLSLLLIVMLVMSLAVTASAAERGETVTVSFNSSGNPGFACYGAEISYDSSALELVDIDDGSMGSVIGNPASNMASFSGSSNVTGDGCLFVATFKVKDSAPAGTYQVTASLIDGANYNAAWEEISFGITGGSVTVTVPPCANNAHEWDWDESKCTSPTCTEPGIAVGTCSKCGTYFEGTSEALGHAYAESSRVEATCTEKGKITYTCAHDMNHTYDEEIPAKGHKYGAWQVRTPATCVAAGVEFRTCSNGCNGEETREIPKKTTHDFSGDPVVTDSTCTAEGSKVWTCVVDGCNETKTEKIEMKDHTPGDGVKVEPTCTEDGSFTGKCAVCGADMNKEVLPKLGHDYKETGRTEATCTEKGKITYVCENDATHTKEEEIPAKGHKYGPWTAVAGTDNHERVCTVCTVAKETKAHDWKLTDKVLPSCVAEGKNTYKCSLCSATKEETVPVDESAHDYAYAEGDASGHRVSCKNEGCDLKPYTEEHDMHETNKVENGKRVWECDCGYKELVKIPVNAADLDDVPKTGDITGQIVAFVICGMAAMMGVVFTFKRKAAK